jgi:hypothetical protein
MEPLSAIQNLLSLNRNAAIIVSAGIGVFAAAAIVSGWVTGDLDTAVTIAVAVIVAGVILTFLSFILGDDILRRVIAWLIALVIFAYVGAIVVSAIAPGQTFIAPTVCLVKFWQNCYGVGGVLDAVAIAREQPVVRSVPAAVSIPPSLDLTRYKVFIQFAGYRRDDIVKLATLLKSRGWNVQGASEGGERLASANSLSEVRYSGASDAAARALADEIVASGVKKTVSTRRINGGADTLEVWIGL